MQFYSLHHIHGACGKPDAAFCVNCKSVGFSARNTAIFQIATPVNCDVFENMQLMSVLVRLMGLQLGPCCQNI